MQNANQIPSEITNHFEQAIADAFRTAAQGDVNTGRLILACARAAAAEIVQSWRDELLALVLKEVELYGAQFAGY